MNLDNYTKLIFNNQASTDYGMLIQYPFNLIHPTVDIDVSHIKGRSGDFLQDNGSYQNVTETFNFIVQRSPQQNWFDWERSIIDWLSPNPEDGDRQYSYLKFSADPNYVFNAVLKDAPSFTKDSDNIFTGTGTIAFYCEPFMYRTNGIEYINLPSSGIVYNQEKFSATPDWHFIAKGNFSLNINGLSYQFENMDGEFWLNGQTGDTYDKDNNLFNSQTHFPNLVPPSLYPGKNTIDITTEEGTTISLAEYKPNWRRLI